MICLYDSKETNFNNNGLVVLSDSKSAYVEERLNDSYEYTLEYPLDNRGKWQYLVEDNIIKSSEGQLFRIYYKVKTLTGIQVNARHIFYDLLDNFLEDVRPTNLGGAGALDWTLSHTQYSHPFTSMSDIEHIDTAYYQKKNPVQAILGNDDNSFVNLWGGEIVRDNFTIKMLQARGLDRGVLISYGKNIIGIEETIDLDSIVTRIYPTGKDGITISEGYVDSSYINNFPHPKIRTVEFNDIDNETDLRTAAQNYFIDTKCDIPQFNYKIDFVELSKTEEYKHYSVLETVYMGDTVTIKHTRLNINLKAKVIRIKKNDLTGRIEEVELGSFKANITKAFTSLNSNISAVSKFAEDTKSSLQNAIDNATTQINSALGGYVVKRNGELLIMDTEDVNTAVQVARWNLNGLGFSNKGVNGPYRTAITRDGHIVADFMDTGTLDASLLKVLNLVVGVNVTMGPNATISWGKVTSQPYIPDDNHITQITNNTISTSNITADNLQVRGANILDTLTADKIIYAGSPVVKIQTNAQDFANSCTPQIFQDTVGIYITNGGSGVLTAEIWMSAGLPFRWFEGQYLPSISVTAANYNVVVGLYQVYQTGYGWANPNQVGLSGSVNAFKVFMTPKDSTFTDTGSIRIFLTVSGLAY